MARMTSTHKVQIIIALITVTGGILVALLTSWDKFFPPPPGPPAPVVQPGPAPMPMPLPVAGMPSAEALERLKQSQEDVVNRSASALDDITDQIDAQSANLAGH